ncbi:MAG: HD domain-containing protein [Clostridia bacterium]|nr:HD domain-containing protein [Clostridia bacterium]
MNSDLINYIENNIFPLYSRNEEGHGINHIKTVIRRSLELSKGYDVDENIVYTVAAYHDLGHFIDRKTHEIISAQMFMEDEKVKDFFTEEERVIIKEAIEDHRASLDHEPRSIYGKIVSSADRTIVDIDDTIRRAYSYGLKNYPEMSYEEMVERVYNHLSEKYGENGYAKNYIVDKEYEDAIRKLREALSNKEEFIKKVKEISKQFNK